MKQELTKLDESADLKVKTPSNRVQSGDLAGMGLVNP